MTAILGPDGSPVASANEGGVTPNKAAPIKAEPRNVAMEDGPLRLRTQLEFIDVTVGGAEVGKFFQAIDSVLLRTGGLGVRIVEMMLLGSQKGIPVSPIIVGVLAAIKDIRTGLEMMLGRMTQGLDPIPSVEVAQAGEPPK